jgi:hypothetical protein
MAAVSKAAHHHVPCPSRHRIDVWPQRCLLRQHRHINCALAVRPARDDRGYRHSTRQKRSRFQGPSTLQHAYNIRYRELSRLNEVHVLSFLDQALMRHRAMIATSTLFAPTVVVSQFHSDCSRFCHFPSCRLFSRHKVQEASQHVD